jgi:hypothetical protein
MIFEENRSPQQIEQDKISVARDQFDLDTMKLRSTLETEITKTSALADKQIIIRRNLDSLISLRKCLCVTDHKDRNDGLLKKVDDKLSELVPEMLSKID